MSVIYYKDLSDEPLLRSLGMLLTHIPIFTLLLKSKVASAHYPYTRPILFAFTTYFLVLWMGKLIMWKKLGLDEEIFICEGIFLANIGFLGKVLTRKKGVFESRIWGYQRVLGNGPDI